MRALSVQPGMEHQRVPAGDGDADLVAAARRERRAFAPLYERYRDDVLRYCFYRLGDWDDAADAAQQIFANALAALPRFVDRGDTFRPWLFRIAHNEVCSRQVRRSRRPQSALQDAGEIVDERDLSRCDIEEASGFFSGFDRRFADGAVIVFISHLCRSLPKQSGCAVYGIKRSAGW